MAIVENDYAAYLKTSDGEIPLRDLDAQEKIGSLSEDLGDYADNVVLLKNRVINFETGKYPYNNQGNIGFVENSTINYAKIKVKSGKTYCVNNANISDAFSFFTDSNGKIISQMSDSYKDLSDGYSFITPEGASYLYAGFSSSITSLVVLYGNKNITKPGLNYQIDDFPYGEIKNVVIQKITNKIGGKDIFESVFALESKINSMNETELVWEIGGISSTDGGLFDTLNRARTEIFTINENRVVSCTDDDWKVGAARYSDDGTFISWSNSASFLILGKGNYRLVAFTTKGLQDVSQYISSIISSIIVKKYSQSYIVSKDGNGDFDDVQKALDFCQFSRKTYPITLIIKSGVYDKISTLTQKKYIDNIPSDNVKWYQRYISLIGTNERDCIIKSESGEYYTPSAEININGMVKNLTFISTHDSPPENKEDETHKAYAMHSDYGTEDSIYENCTFISYQAPAVGIGGAKDKKIRFRNCHLYSYAPTDGDYSGLVDFGALFYHLMNADGITGQLLEVENCYIYSENGDKSAWITKSNATNFEQETHLRNNCFFGKISGKTVSVDAEMLSEDCYGNNIEALNV